MVRVAPMTHTLMFWPAARVPDIASPLCLLSPQDAARKRESAKHRTTTTRSSIAQADENSYRADRKLLSLLLRGRRLRSEGSDGRRGDLELLAEGENQTMSGVFSVALDGRCGEDDSVSYTHLTLPTKRIV